MIIDHRIVVHFDDFHAIIEGKKTFEICKNNDDYYERDIVLIQEIDEDRQYTGKELLAEITYVSAQSHIEGYIIWSFRLLKNEELFTQAEISKGETVELAFSELIEARNKNQVLYVKLLKVLPRGDALVKYRCLTGIIPESEMSLDFKKKLDSSTETKIEKIDVIVTSIRRNSENSYDINFSQLRVLDQGKLEEAIQMGWLGKTVAGTVIKRQKNRLIVNLPNGLIGLLRRGNCRTAYETFSKGFSAGKDIQVKIIRIDQERGRIDLLYKPAGHDPWLEWSNNHVVGDTVLGRISRADKTSFYVDLENGVQGVIPRSQLTWSRTLNAIAGINELPFDLELPLEIEKVDNLEEVVTLSRKKVMSKQVVKYLQQNDIGDFVEGVVIYVSDHGLYLMIEDDVIGYVPTREIAEKQSRMLAPTKGERTQAIIIGADKTKRRLTLSIKAAARKSAEKQFQGLSEGDEIRGSIVKVCPFGLFVHLFSNLDGLVHISTLPESIVTRLEEEYTLGQEVDVRVIAKDVDKSRVSLELINS